jgi:IS30 family transposase
MKPDEPGRELDRPHKKLDLIQAYKMRVFNRLSFAEIAKALSVPKSTVHAALHRLNDLIPDPSQVAAYEAVEASVLTSAKARLLASCLDSDVIAKASLNNRAYAFSQVANHERLVKGQATSNIGVLAKLIVQADQGLFEKKPSETV